LSAQLTAPGTQYSARLEYSKRRKSEAFFTISKLFSFKRILQHFMLQISPHDDWKNDLMTLLNTYTEIDQAMMGFPTGWQQDLFWSVVI